MPRWSLGILSLVQAAAFSWAAWVLPWTLTLFVVATGLLAALHVAVAVLAFGAWPALPKVWRLQCWGACAYLAYLSYGLFTSAFYLNALYAGVGRGVAAVLVCAVLPVVLLTLPSACWGFAKTGGLRWSRRTTGAALLVLLFAAGQAFVAKGRAALVESPFAVNSSEAFVAELAASLPNRPAQSAPGPSLYTIEPVSCEHPIDAQRATLVVTYVPRGDTAPRSQCVQTAAAGLLSAAAQVVASAEPGYVRFDLVRGARTFWSPFEWLEPLVVRPALDGVCAGGRCLMPWQLVALDLFNSNQPLAAIPDIKFGVARATLARALDAPSAELSRIETLGVVLDPAGTLHLEVEPAAAVPLAPAALVSAASAAEGFIEAAQGENGQFAYVIDPFNGETPDAQLVLSRQAGTTLAWCEHAASANKKLVAERSLALLAARARQFEARAALADRAADSRGRLGQNSLPLAAFLACRSLVGDRYDALIGDLARLLLQQQRGDGGFTHGIDLKTGRPRPGPNTLYADGQAVLALSLLEALGSDASPHFPAVAETRAAVERAMSYFGGPYWQFFAAQFFFIAENWHCIAAAASLPHHRHDAYERFCLDYMKLQERLTLDATSGVRPEYLGGHGFGNFFPPHTTPAAGHVEALAAAIFVKRARGLDVEADTRSLTALLGFLLRNQRGVANCFACSRERSISGGFGENAASPKIRIDYVQHAWAALSLGARVLTPTDRS